jgi:serine/threonine protein kinase
VFAGAGLFVSTPGLGGRPGGGTEYGISLGFGIAKSDQPTDGGEATATVIGTPSYLAPERAAGAPAGVGSDLWVVGVVLCEALTAAKPFQGPTPLAGVTTARGTAMGETAAAITDRRLGWGAVALGSYR